MIECGLCEVDITPPLGLPIPGYFEPRPASGILDTLYAKAVVIVDGNRTVIMIALDTIGIEREETLAIRSLVTERTGVPGSCILIAGTHTHTGPPVYRDRGPAEQAYVDFLIRKAADAAVMAYNGKKEARVGIARGSEDTLSFNRRYYMRDGSVRTNPGYNNPDIVRPAGPIDPDVTVLRIDGKDGEPLGVVTWYACHPDTIGGNRFSADYPGELSRTLKALLGEQTVCLFFNGACGNINHLNFFGEGFPAPGYYRSMGRQLAGEVFKVRERARLIDELHVDGTHSVLQLDVRKPDPREVDKAEALVRAAAAGVGQPVNSTDLFFAKHLLTLRDRNETTTPAEVQVIRIGELAVTAIPSELFVEFGLDLKSRAPFDYSVVAAYANGVNGYVATREAFTQGGYETRLTARTRLAPDSGDRMVEEALGQMNGLKGGNGE